VIDSHIMNRARPDWPGWSRSGAWGRRSRGERVGEVIDLSIYYLR
jgi:hypothetical protein